MRFISHSVVLAVPSFGTFILQETGLPFFKDLTATVLLATDWVVTQEKWNRKNPPSFETDFMTRMRSKGDRTQARFPALELRLVEICTLFVEGKYVRGSSPE